MEDNRLVERKPCEKCGEWKYMIRDSIDQMFCVKCTQDEIRSEIPSLLNEDNVHEIEYLEGKTFYLAYEGKKLILNANFRYVDITKYLKKFKKLEGVLNKNGK